MSWICLVPDGTDEWDFVDFATNDEEGVNGHHLFDEAVVLFKKLWHSYAREDKGLYIGGKCYKKMRCEYEKWNICCSKTT